MNKKLNQDLLLVDILVEEVQESFKICPMCGYSWSEKVDFLNDTSLDYIGSQGDCEYFKNELHYFTHNRDECGTTVGVLIDRLPQLNHKGLINDN